MYKCECNYSLESGYSSFYSYYIPEKWTPLKTQHRKDTRPGWSSNVYRHTRPLKRHKCCSSLCLDTTAEVTAVLGSPDSERAPPLVTSTPRIIHTINILYHSLLWLFKFLLKKKREGEVGTFVAPLLKVTLSFSIFSSGFVPPADIHMENKDMNISESSPFLPCRCSEQAQFGAGVVQQPPLPRSKTFPSSPKEPIYYQCPVFRIAGFSGPLTLESL